ncbi:DNA-binding protein Alba [Candidatus Bathyarchaeota archaeon]|nr:MAG: DNA-binding protein Alba [Candidatus Hecatellales archaeon ex4484_218]RJX16167.1 MAG: DNA-binding protein Alba [Candidatus Bathyarchaeota archaeon]
MAEQQEAKPNVVLVGKKPVMNYVVACVTFFNQGINNIVLKARGAAISKAVDVAELLKRAFVKDLVVKNISIGTEIVERESRKSNVSTIEISIEKPAA